MINLHLAIYLEVNLVAVLLSVMILLNRKSENDRQAASQSYSRVVFATLFILLVDAAWVLTENQPGELFIGINYVLDTLYMILTGVIPYLWLEFVLRKLPGAAKRKKSFLAHLRLPLWVLIVMSLLSPWTHWLFWIDEGNVYRRGPLLAVQQAIGYIYMLAAFGYALAYALRKENAQWRAEALSISAFPILPAIGGIVNVLVPGMPTIWPLAAISQMIVYMNLLSLQISTDELTGLNNRRQYDRYLSAQIESLRQGRRLYLILMDIDAFKGINDTYGHAAGDRALVETAGVLKQACRGMNCFVARYGGDEFVIVFECDAADKAEGLKRDIAAAFAQFNACWTEPFSLTISMGVGEYSPYVCTPVALFSQADKALYEEKARKKLKR